MRKQLLHKLMLYLFSSAPLIVHTQSELLTDLPATPFHVNSEVAIAIQPFRTTAASDFTSLLDGPLTGSADNVAKTPLRTQSFLLPVQKRAYWEFYGEPNSDQSTPVAKGHRQFKRRNFKKAYWYYRHTSINCPDKPAAYLASGVAHYFEDKRLFTPANRFRLALALDPTNPAILYNIGLVNLLQGRFQNAVDTFELLAIGGTNGHFFHYNTGLVYALQGQTEQAIEQFNLAIDGAHGDNDARLNRAWLYLGQNRLSQAGQDLKKRDNKNLSGQLALGEWNRKSFDLPRAQRHYERAHRIAPQDVAPLLGLTKVSVLQKRYEAATKYLSEAAQLAGLSADIKLDMAAIMLLTGNADEALSTYQNLWAEKSLHVESGTGIGMALCQKGQYTQAISYFEAVLSIRPDYQPALYGLGAALFHSGRQKDAIAPLCQALDKGVFPQEKMANLMLGLAFASIGEEEKALKHLKNAEGIGGRSEASAHHEAGLLFYDKKKYVKALACFDRAVTLAPDVPEVFVTRGNTHFWLGNYTLAEADYRKAINLDSSNKEAWNGLGLASNQLRKYPEAIAAYHRALTLDSTYAWLHSNLGHTYKDMGLRCKRQGRVDSATHYLNLALLATDEAIRLTAQNNKFFLNNRGLALMDLGKEADALAEYNNSLTQASKNNIAVFHFRKGATTQALQFIEQAVTMDSSYSVPRYNRLRMLLEVDSNGNYSPRERRRIEQLRATEPLTSPFEDKFISIWYIHNENQAFRDVAFQPEIPMRDLEPVFAPARLNFQVLPAQADCSLVKDGGLNGAKKKPYRPRKIKRYRGQCPWEYMLIFSCF